jgi:uncharacterized membrane protein
MYRPWLVHNHPRYIEIEGSVMKNAITCLECWGYDMFDIAIRRIQQLDRGMYPDGIIFRLIFESDFAVHAHPSFYITHIYRLDYTMIFPRNFIYFFLSPDACPWKCQSFGKCTSP